MTSMWPYDPATEGAPPDLGVHRMPAHGWVISKWSRLGVAVRDRRRERGMTQAELAQAAGVSRGWLVRFERGLDNAEAGTVFRVLQTLDLELVVRPHVPTDEEDLLSEALGD